MVTNLADIDDLFRRPLPEFTAARNALAARLKAAGRSEAAAFVKEMAKPSVSAWVANQLFWRHREAFDRLIAAGDRLRKVHAAQLRGKSSDMREATEARQKALAELTKRGAAILDSHKHAPTPDLMRRVATTLDALATYGGAANAPQAGHLTADVDPPGFETLAALIPRGSGRARGTSAPRVLPFQSPREKARRNLDPKARKRQEEEARKAERAAAIQAVQEAKRALGEARKGAARAEAALKKAAAIAKQAERKKDALAARVENVTASSDAARQHARRIAGEAEEAAQLVEDAERALDDAQHRRKTLE